MDDRPNQGSSPSRLDSAPVTYKESGAESDWRPVAAAEIHFLQLWARHAVEVLLNPDASGEKHSAKEQSGACSPTPKGRANIQPLSEVAVNQNVKH